ncbi:MAG: hypothetical protein NTU79_20450 [Planctomycetota bacterium]|nr:hypothetical protein [Planctomycetota bacterium]
MKNLWKRIFSKSEDQNVTPDLEPQASEQSKATDLIDQSADRHLWATNAPEHWPAVIGSRQLNSMGFGNSLTADPFGLIGFAAMFVEACKSTQDSVSIENLDASAFGPEVSFLVNDRGLTVPVIIYPEATLRASVHFQQLSARLRDSHAVDAVYYAPSPLPESNLKLEPQSLRVNTDSIFSRVVSKEFRTGPAIQGNMIVREVGKTGLGEALVIDSDSSMTFVNAELLSKLGMSAEQAFTHARRNLKGKLPENLPGMLFDRKMMPSYKTGDGFDAARILALPEMLKEGQFVAAIIPDRDTLMLLGISKDKDNEDFWETLSDFPSASEHPIHARPLLVTRNGIELR